MPMSRYTLKYPPCYIMNISNDLAVNPAYNYSSCIKFTNDEIEEYVHTLISETESLV